MAEVSEDVISEELDGLKEEVIAIRRVAKVLKGGRRFSFSAIVSVGDGNGKVGIGFGKAREVPEAIRKAINRAKKRMFTVPIVNGTIPHPILCKYKAGKVLLKPAAPGTGLIASISIRPILSCVGIKDILSKSLGSNTPVTVVRTVEKALRSLMSEEDVKNSKEGVEE